MVVWRLLLGVAVLLAIGTLIVVYNRNLRARRSTWPTCTGKILDARVTTKRIVDPKGIGGSVRLLTLRYSYAVNGSTYQGEGTSDSTENEPYLLASYGPGAPVEVSYDPAKPNVSEIADPDMHQGMARLVALLLVFGFIALVFGFMSGLFS